MPVKKVGDLNFYYEIHGKGEPLVLIQGLGGDMTKWFRLTPALAAECRVIVFDNRGAGRSDKPDTPYSMEMMADDTAGLMDAIGLESAHIFGISMGGMIAQHFALRHTHKVRTLMLGCTRCGGPHSIIETGGPMPLNPDLVKNLTAEERAREMLPFLWSEEFIGNNPEIVEEQIASASTYPIDPKSYERQLQAANGHDTWDRLPNITVPTLVIAGDGDRLIPVENSRILAERIPGAELVIQKGTGHGFYSEAVEDTKRTLLEFMQRRG